MSVNAKCDQLNAEFDAFEAAMRARGIRVEAAVSLRMGTPSLVWWRTAAGWGLYVLDGGSLTPVKNTNIETRLNAARVVGDLYEAVTAALVAREMELNAAITAVRNATQRVTRGT